MTQNIDHKTLLWKTSFIKETKNKNTRCLFFFNQNFSYCLEINTRFIIMIIESIYSSDTFE